MYRSTTVAALCLAAVLTGCSDDSTGKGSPATTAAPSSSASSTPSTTIDTSPSTATSSEESSDSSSSSSSGSAAEVPSKDACTVLTAADFTAAGETIGTPRADSYDGGPGCDYGPVKLYYVRTDGYFHFGDQVPVSGLGDEAFYNSNIHYLRVKKGDVRIEVRAVVLSGDEKTELTALAAAAISRF